MGRKRLFAPPMTACLGAVPAWMRRSIASIITKASFTMTPLSQKIPERKQRSLASKLTQSVIAVEQIRQEFAFRDW